jgi:hypothetical protein
VCIRVSSFCLLHSFIKKETRGARLGTYICIYEISISKRTIHVEKVWIRLYPKKPIKFCPKMRQSQWAKKGEKSQHNVKRRKLNPKKSCPIRSQLDGRKRKSSKVWPRKSAHV